MMKYVFITFSIMLFSPIASCNTEITTVFSWLDSNGVMHFTDEKPKQVSAELITTIDIEDTDVLGVPRMMKQVTDVSNVENTASHVTDSKVSLISASRIKKQ